MAKVFHRYNDKILVEIGTQRPLYGDPFLCCCSSSTTTSATTTSTSGLEPSSSSSSSTSTSTSTSSATCCESLPNTITADLTAEGDGGTCSSRSVTMTKISDFIWEGQIEVWCTDPENWDIQFRCRDNIGGTEFDFDFRVNNGGGWSAWETASDISCNPLYATGIIPSSEITNSCCLTTPGDITVVFTE